MNKIELLLGDVVELEKIGALKMVNAKPLLRKFDVLINDDSYPADVQVKLYDASIAVLWADLAKAKAILCKLI